MKQMEPQLTFRGTFNNKEAHLLLWERKITTTEFVLLAVIDSHIGEEGCWASYPHLAKWCKVQGRQILRMVRHLKHLGILIDIGEKVIGNQKRRILVTKWVGVRGDINVTGDINRTQIRSSLLRKDSLKGEMMENRFFGVEELPIKISQKDAECANYLLETIKKKGRVNSSVSIKNWAKSFSKLRSELIEETPEAKDKRIERALQWHRKNYGEKYTPIIRSGHAFRMKFLSIEAGLYRDEPDIDVKPTTEAEQIYQSVNHLHWPKGSKVNLLKVIQKSLNEYRKFLKKLKPLIKKDKKARRIWDCCIDPGYFVSRWFHSVNERINNVADWKGKIENFQFGIDHRMFTEMARQWMQEYSGDPSNWDKLAERLL